jgi:hypothetical protein
MRLRRADRQQVPAVQLTLTLPLAPGASRRDVGETDPQVIAVPDLQVNDAVPMMFPVFSILKMVE